VLRAIDLAEKVSLDFEFEPRLERDRDRNLANNFARARRAQHRARNLRVALDYPPRPLDHRRARRPRQMRDQHFAAAIADDFDLLALDFGRERARHPDYRRRYHAM